MTGSVTLSPWLLVRPESVNAGSSPVSLRSTSKLALSTFADRMRRFGLSGLPMITVAGAYTRAASSSRTVSSDFTTLPFVRSTEYVPSSFLRSGTSSMAKKKP